ncbi:MAG: FMN-dependent NADH-azoreductase [Methyloligellaceae bacterium]
MNEQWINANFTPGEKRTSEQRAILAQSDALVSELQEADEIVIALPVYNFSVPAAFKAWIDLVARVGLTFHYTENGPVGLLANKKAYVILTSGGTQMGSEIDFASGFARHVLGFIGIMDVTFIDGSGVGQNEQKVLASAEEQIYSI